MTFRPELQAQMVAACRRLLSGLDRDRYSTTRGCFDRRYWAWKVIDLPELTYQRNALALAWLLTRSGEALLPRDALRSAIDSAFEFTHARQHRDGSFDQAFPGEHSYGATAFLLHDLGAAVRLLQDHGEPVPAAAEPLLRRAAAFLAGHREQHGFIANHLAGAAAGLFEAGALLCDSQLAGAGERMLQTVLHAQTDEGWFPEYGGADPGYQSLCVHYLAAIWRQRPDDDRLRSALVRAIAFLAWFAHPDGSFGGEYGSRRTAVLYPGGLATVAAIDGTAAALSAFAQRALAEGRSPGLAEVDTGNIAPMFANYLAAVASADVGAPPQALPAQCADAQADFPRAGLFVRITPHYFAVVGASNGGVIKTFTRSPGALKFEDAGYVGGLSGGRVVTTQTRAGTTWVRSGDGVTVETAFSALPRLVPSAASFAALRIAGLTVFRSASIREWLKRVLVGRLVTPAGRVGIELRRAIRFTSDVIEVDDRISGATALAWLESGAPFVAVHMASARYFPGFACGASMPIRHDVPGAGQEWRRSFRIECR